MKKLTEKEEFLQRLKRARIVLSLKDKEIIKKRIFLKGQLWSGEITQAQYDKKLKELRYENYKSSKKFKIN